MDKGERSILCFDLNVRSLEGMSNKESGPNGQQVANNANIGSSDLRACP